MPATLPSVVVLLAVILIIVGLGTLLADVYLRDRTRIKKRMAEEFGKEPPARRRGQLFRNLAPLSPEMVVEEEAQTTRKRFERMVQQSGVQVTPERLLTIAAGCGLLFGLLMFLMLGNPLVAVLFALAGGALPLFYIQLKWKGRMDKLLNQIPEAFELMARVIRAGQTMAQALQAVADEFEPPIATEFGYCYEQQNLGLPFENALRELSVRTGLLEIKVLVLALLVQQETGGNLATILENLATIVRGRTQIRGKVKVLTAEGRMQAAVLLGLPPVAFLAMMVVNRPYAMVLVQHPKLIFGMLLSMGIGWYWIRRIVNFDF